MNRNRCLTYISVPHVGYGFVQTCVSILENFPQQILFPTLVLPRAFQAIRPSVEVRQTVPRLFPFKYASRIIHPSLNYRFKQALANESPNDTIVYFWPNCPTPLVIEARKRGFLTIREMTNTCIASARNVLKDAYERLRLPFPYQNEAPAMEERQQLQLYNYIFSPNPMVEESLIENGVQPNRILRSSFGWSPERFSQSVGDRNRNGFTALFVGNVCVRKGAPTLLAAWHKSGVAGELLLAGGIEESLKPMLASHLEGGRIRLAGFVKDVGALYKSADVFVFPSLEEGDPQVTYEAAACGLPVIATPMGTANIVRHGINGLVVQPYDVDGLAAAITCLATSPELRSQFGRQAAQDARQFTYEKIGRDRANTLNQLLFSWRKRAAAA